MFPHALAQGIVFLSTVKFVSFLQNWYSLGTSLKPNDAMYQPVTQKKQAFFFIRGSRNEEQISDRRVW